MLNCDFQLSHDVVSKTKGKHTSAKEEQTVGFHFVAFVPIDGQIWKLDGLERQPQKVCSIVNDDWIRQTKPQIEARMAEYEEGQIEFSILSLVKEPLSKLFSELAQTVKSLSALLNSDQASEESFMSAIDPANNGIRSGSALNLCLPDVAFGLTQDMIDQAVILPGVQDAIQNRNVSILIQLWNGLTIDQASLKASISEERLSCQWDQERAESRRWDYGPAVHHLVCLLARKQFFRTSNTRNISHHWIYRFPSYFQCCYSN